MPPKKKAQVGGRKKPQRGKGDPLRLLALKKRFAQQHGDGWLGDAWDWTKGAANTVYRKALVPAHDFVKKHKIISRGANLYGTLTGDTRGKIVGTAAGALGYGQRKLKPAAMNGSGQKGGRAVFYR